MKHFSLIVCVTLALSLGCNSSEPPTQTAPADAKPVPALPPGHPALPSDGSQLPAGHPSVDMSKQGLAADLTAPEAGNPKWTVPADWKPGKVSSVRRGSFQVAGGDDLMADIAITVFPGDVGGLLANINRWRAQIGLAPAAQGDLEKMTSTLDVNGVKVTLADFTSEKAPEGRKNPTRMLVATIPQAGNSWFIKMTGDAPVVEAQKDAFLGFVKSVKF